jgi:hypothetical protein
MFCRHMFKWHFFVVCCFIFSIDASQAVSVSSPGYSASDDVTYDWIDIRSTGTRVLADDYWVEYPNTIAPIDFDFSFYGRTCNSVLITPYGMLDFAAYPDTNSNGPGGWNKLPYTNYYYNSSDPLAAVCWGNFSTVKDISPATDAVYYQTSGELGSRKMVIQWQDVAQINDSSGGTGSFEAIL